MAATRCVIAKVADFSLEVSEFELKSGYYIHIQTSNLWKTMNLLILPVMGYILPLLSFYSNFVIK